MRVLLAANATYDPPRGGSTRSNLVWLRSLAEAGHACRVVCASDGESRSSEIDGIEIRSVRDLSRRASALSEYIREFGPDWVLVSSEDVSHVLLREAHNAAAGRIVYLAHTPQWYPFGPASWNPDPHAASMVRDAAGVVAISHAMAAYIREFGGTKPIVIHPPMYGNPPSPRLGSFRNRFVLTVNPSVVKGITIFLRLAERFPELQFGGLAGWGTTRADREAMARLPNVTVLGSVPSIDEVLAQARVLLMPSLWLEGFGLIAMEAMLRGVPVIASDSGGLVEAKAGTGYVIPVHSFERFEPVFDEAHMPKPVDVRQEIEPWVDALRVLTTDEAAYAAEAERSREAAIRFVSRLDARDFGAYLGRLQPSNVAAAPAPIPTTPNLSDAKRALLLKRLREKR
ncbi:MAG TPA: glycosyltransferase family 4 protein [Bryobacteraceae bacterium]|nr:glycosyltransferase family 4 protein [Bryobacteraceae bacterium]